MSLRTKLSAAPSAAGLLRWHKWLAFIYGAQAVTFVLLSVDKSVPLSLPFLTPDSLQIALTGSPVIATATHQVFEVNLVLVVAASLVVATLLHIWQLTSNKTRYTDGLRLGVSGVRWVGFAVSGGLMTVALAMLAGMYDLSALIMLFGLAATAFLSGFFMEAYNPLRASTIRWHSIAVGAIAGAAAWTGIGLILLADWQYGNGGVPTFVYWAAVSGLVLASSAPINLYLQQKRIGPWKNYLFSERSYMIIALVTETALVWQIFAGALHP